MTSTSDTITPAGNCGNTRELLGDWECVEVPRALGEDGTPERRCLYYMCFAEDGLVFSFLDRDEPSDKGLYCMPQCYTVLGPPGVLSLCVELAGHDPLGGWVGDLKVTADQLFMSSSFGNAYRAWRFERRDPLQLPEWIGDKCEKARARFRQNEARIRAQREGLPCNSWPLYRGGAVPWKIKTVKWGHEMGSG